MITFTCNKAALMRLILMLGACLIVPDRARPRYFELCKNGRLIGHWNGVSGDGEIHPGRLVEPLETLIYLNK